ncbi:MAG: monofunctional biosynthetic peptidoglycan transglycosylase [Pseudomonadota bacterium]
MSLHIYTERRKPKRKSRRKSAAEKSPLSSPRNLIKFIFRWLRNIILIFIAFTLLITLSVRWINPPYTSFMIIQRMETNFVPYKINWVSINEISSNLSIAAVAAEDQKFPMHYGFDLKAIQSAIETNKNKKSIRGASTITQQVAKNVFLWPKKSLFRKGLEAYFTVLIETLWPKWRILEVYLNVAEFGPNIFGAKNASYTHFKKHASQLTQQEAALLAAVLPNPHKMHASNPSDYVQQRAAYIRSQVSSLGGSNYLATIWD